MLKNKLKYYFASEILKSYFFVLITMTLLLWVTQAARYLYLVTEAGIPINSYVKYIILLIPKITSQMMIISFLISMFLNILKFQSNKELEIYWISGISKKEIILLIYKISILITILAIFFYIFLSPYANGKSRNILANSEFSLVNTLVKKNNFNSPLKNLTIFVNKNNNKGNLEKVYIFENNKTIISQKGTVVNVGEKNYLELENGIIHEKDDQKNIKSIKFEKTLYDFTKYQSNIITTPKIQEISFLNILDIYNKEKNYNYLYEIHKRIFKPLLIPIIALLCCFNLYSNNEKINLNKIKIIIFSLSTILIIFFEALLNFSSINIYAKYFLYFFPVILSLITYNMLIYFLKTETTK